MSAAPETPRRGREPGAFPRRPALPAALLFIVGIFLHAQLAHAPLLWSALAVACVFAGIVAFHRAYVCSALIAVALICIGASVAQLEAFHYPSDHISAYATDEPRLAQMELVIDHEPRVLTDPFGAHPMPPKQVVTARVTRVLTWDGWTDASGGILVQIAQPHPRLALGQTVRVVGLLERPAPAMNPGQFDWAGYYREQRILNSVHIPLADDIHILSQRTIGPIDLLRRETRTLLAAGFTFEQSLDHALLRALLLGDNDPELRDVQEQFRRTGTSHHISVSGLHVAVLSGFVYGICRLLRLRPRFSAIITIAFAILYGLVALPAPPILRSIILCCAVGAGVLWRRSIDVMQLLALSILALLIVHPLDLFNAGFQLSFGTVLALMLFAGPFTRWLRSFRQEFDPPPAISGSSTAGLFRRSGKWCEQKFSDAFGTGLVAWFVSMPLIWFHFSQFNAWAVPAGLLLGPLVFLALIGGLLKVVLTLLLPSLAPVWASGAAAPVGWMRGLLGHLARLPGNDFSIPALPVWAALVLYALMLLFLAPTAQSKLRIMFRGAPIAACAMALALPLRHVERAVSAESLSLTLLSLGAGQCAVVQTPGGKTVVIDAGSSSLSDALRKCIAPYLRASGCTSVDTLLLTHADYDHISAAGALAQGYDVREVLTGGRFRAHAVGNAPAEALLRALDAMDRPPRVVRPGEHIPLGRDAELEVLWPPSQPDALAPAKLSSNDSAVVARLKFAGRSILITGDIQDAAEAGLMKEYPADQLHADVLIAPHHGSSESTTADFLRAVDPQAIISSNDRSLTGKQKRLDRLVGDRPIYRTHRCGAVTVRLFRDGTVRVETYLHPRP